MPVTDVQQDLENRTLTITADFAAPVKRIWQIYADPRQLERVWGPPTYPATIVDHDLRPGGRVTYLMTGPDGDKHAGYWEVTAVDEPRFLLQRRRHRGRHRSQGQLPRLKVVELAGIGTRWHDTPTANRQHLNRTRLRQVPSRAGGDRLHEYRNR